MQNQTRILKFDKSIFVFAYVFLLLPVAIFFLSWTKLYIGIPVALLLLFSFIKIIRVPRNYKNPLGDKYRKKLIVLVVASLCWTLLSGIGGVFYQNSDHFMRNAIYYDLINYDWPVVFHIPQSILDSLTPGSILYENALPYAGKSVTIVYYMAFWLVPGLLGKLSVIVFGKAAGMILAQIFLFLWAFAGVFTVMYMFSRLFKKFSYILPVIVIAFSGMDILGALPFYIVDAQGLLNSGPGRIIPHLEAWTYQQFTSNTAALFWVFNQAVPLWVFCCLLLNEKSYKYLLLPFACLALSSTIPLIGLVPLLCYYVVWDYLSRHKKTAQSNTQCAADDTGTSISKDKSLALSAADNSATFSSAVNNDAGKNLSTDDKTYAVSNAAVKHQKLSSRYDMSANSICAYLREYVNIPNIVGLVTFVIIYLYLMSSPHSASFSLFFSKHSGAAYAITLVSLLFEAGILVAVLFALKKGREKSLLITISVTLALCPLFLLGTRYDFVMRASLPALFVLMYIAARTLLDTPKSQLKTILATVLILGSVTALFEILQPIAYAFTGQSPTASLLKSLGEVNKSNIYDPTNCLGFLDSFFMKYIARI